MIKESHILFTSQLEVLIIFRPEHGNLGTVVYWSTGGLLGSCLPLLGQPTTTWNLNLGHSSIII